MDAGKLIRMANQIADFFRAYPEAEAVAGIREHILAFWTPRMRATALEAARAGAEGLDPLARQAVLGLAPAPVEPSLAAVTPS